MKTFTKNELLILYSSSLSEKVLKTHKIKKFMFKANNRNTIKRCKICQKLITKTLE